MEDPKHPHELNFNVSSIDVLVALYFEEITNGILGVMEDIGVQKVILFLLACPMIVGSGMYVYWKIELDRLEEVNRAAIVQPARRKDGDQ